MTEVRLGYVANCLSIELTASHTCRVAGATPDRIAELVAENLIELEQIFEFNAMLGIRLFRVGSSLVPLASHPVNRLRWWTIFARDFAYLGALANRTGQRLSMHPSPAGASLSSARESVRTAAVAELLYSTRVLDLLEQGPEARIIVHLGGAAPDKPTALEAAHRFLDAMPDDARRRIGIENDDRIWSAREVLPVARAHGLPFVADPLHNAVFPSDPPLSTRELFALASATWHELGLRPKHHLASQRSGARPGAHAERIDLKDWAEALAGIVGPTDFMLEAKDKDLALLELRSRGARLARQLDIDLDGLARKRTGFEEAREG